MIYRYVNINELNIEEISKKVSNERIEKSKKFKSETDKKRSIAVEYLLNEMIDEIYDGFTPVKLTYDKNGKPHIYDDVQGNDLVQFSLSHSGDYVACIISNRPCGIDIERHSEKRDYEKIAKRVLTENELVHVKSKEDLYNFWTLKESVMKAVGIGLSLDMRKIDFSANNDDWSATVNDVKYIGKVLNAPEGYSLSYVEMII